MKIRQEIPCDVPDVHHLTATAFANMPEAEGDEAEFVLRMRASDGYIAKLALIAETAEGALAAHVMLTHLPILPRVGGNETLPKVLLLAIISVAPNLQRKGIGTNLLREALHRAKSLGFSAVIVLGEPAFYGRFGFRASIDFGLRNTNHFPDEYSQALELTPGALSNLTGTYHLPS